MFSGLTKDLAKLCAMLLLLLPVNSFSLGLGEINLHSALNQSLDAEISLLSVGNTDVEDIVVKIASKEVFDKAGLERPFFLTKLKFTVAKRTNGETYLKITSHEPVKEPFLDFIIEANWPSGRALREYTLLLDPPVLVDERPAALDIPLLDDAASPADASTAAPDSASVAPGVASAREAPRFSPRASTVSVADSGKITYGPVKRTDTLWKIASEMRPDRSVTVPQVMIALLKENPEAFDNQNINDLKAGYFLRISDPTAISAVSSTEAARIAAVQYEEWVDAKHNSALAAGQRPLGVKRNGSGVAGVAANTESRLKLVASEDGVSQSGSGSKLGASDDDVRQELAFALESVDVSRQENEELRKRLSALEEQLASMQRLITLKGDTLSAMQVSPEVLAGSAANDDASVLPDDVELSKDAAVSDAIEANDEPQADVAVADTPAKAVVPPVVVPPAPTDEASMVDDVLATIDSVVGDLGSMLNLGSLLGGIDPMIALGGLAVVALAIGALVVRRRKMAAFEEELSEIDYSSTSGDEVAVDENVSDEAVESVLNDVIPEYSNSGGMDVSDDDEIDAIAEADVYLAYRRFDKAEELLREAVQNEPGRHDIQLKLLEVYSASDKKDAFIEQAESLRESLGGTDNDTWRTVAVMGQKIAPTSALFNNEVDAVMGSTGISDELDVDLPDLGGDLDLGDLELSDSDVATKVEPVSESENPFSDVTSDEIDELDLDLDSLGEPELGDAFDALDDLGELEASLDSAMDMMSDEVVDVDASSQKKESNTVSSDDIGVVEEALDNEFELDTVADIDDSLNLPEVSEVADELSFEENIDEFSSDVSANESLDVASDEPLIDDAAVETVVNDEVAVVDELDLDDVVSEASDEFQSNDDLEFEAGLASPESAVDELALDDEQLSAFDVNATENKVEEAVEAVEAVESVAEVADGDDVEDDLFAGLDESSSDTAASDDDWLSDFSDEISSLDEDLDELEDSELFSAEDEVGTKLDLARAYIDMGDNESAKGILDEVVNDGNDDQKKDANELIERIA